MSVGPLQQALERAVIDEVTPSAQAVVLHRGQRAFEGAAGRADLRTVFDLASLTKVLSTTAAFMALWGEGKLGPDTPLLRFFPESPAAKGGVRLLDLLYHRSGLPAFKPFFARVMPAVPELFSPDCSPQTWQAVRDEVVRAASESSAHKLGAVGAVYSDVGFILLGEALAQAAQLPLDQLYQTRVADRLGLGARFRRLSTSKASSLEGSVDSPLDLAPTGSTRPREPAPGQETMWQPLPVHDSPPGEVDDDNAWVMDGVAGHAGLFGTADDVARFGQAVLDEVAGAGKLAHPRLWERALAVDPQTPGSTRALGFDTPSAQGSSAGARLAANAPLVVGHTGFTGTSLWIDLRRELVVALVTNRTALGRANLGIRTFRPAFHDTVVDALGL